MPTTIKLARAKLIYKGEWDADTIYSKGDIVQVTPSGNSPKLFVYNNDVSVKGSYPYIQTITGVAVTIGVSTDSVDMTLDHNPGDDFHYHVVPGKTLFYSKYYNEAVGITSFTKLNNNTVKLYLDETSNVESETVDREAILGPRRYADRYDRSTNNKYWDLYSESSTFRGEWRRDGVYDSGDIVVRNHQSYIANSPVGYGTGTVGTSSMTDAVDPELDVYNIWDDYATPTKDSSNRAVMFSCGNPVGWKGHPFIPQPTWSMSGIGSHWMGNTPYKEYERLSGDEFYKKNHWRWNASQNNLVPPTGTNAGLCIQTIDNTGKHVTHGGRSGDAASTNASATAGQNTHVYGMFGECDSYSNVGFFNNEEPGFGGEEFNGDQGIFPKTTPGVIQFVTVENGRLYLFSDGTVGVSGQNDIMLGFGDNTDTDSGAVRVMKKSLFKNRNIVKISARGIDGFDAMLLDEWGEIWWWGNNANYQSGFGHENVNRKQVSEGISTYWGGGGHEYTNGARTLNTPMCLTKHAFGGRRIVDIFTIGAETYMANMALDEEGYLWSWGINNLGQLGYPTIAGNGFVNASYAFAPQRITSTLGYGITVTPMDDYGNQVLVGSGLTWSDSTTEQGFQVTKTAANGANGAVYSGMGFTGSCAIQCKVPATFGSSYFYIGFSTNPGSTLTYTDMNFCWYINNAGGYSAYENGTAKAMGGGNQVAIAGTSFIRIVYDHTEGYVNYYYDRYGNDRWKLMYRTYKDERAPDFDSTLFPKVALYYVGSGVSSIVVSGINTAGVGTEPHTKTFADYDGLQKVVSGEQISYVHWLTGNGEVFSAGENTKGMIGNETNTDYNNATSIQIMDYGLSYQTSNNVSIAGSVANIWTMWDNTVYAVDRGYGDGSTNTWITGDNGLRQCTTKNATNQNRPVLLHAPSGRHAAGISTEDLVDPVHFVSFEGYNNTFVTYHGLDRWGQPYVAGKNIKGNAGAIGNGNTEDEVVVQNVGKMQQLDSMNESWLRVFLPNTQYGKIVDMYSQMKYDDYASSPGPPIPNWPFPPVPGPPIVSYEYFGITSWLSERGDVMSAGAGDLGYRYWGFFPNQGPRVQIPFYSQGFN